MRNGVGIFDTSPLFKYRITGPEAVDFLSGVVVRDLSACGPGGRRTRCGATTAAS